MIARDDSHELQPPERPLNRALANSPDRAPEEVARPGGTRREAGPRSLLSMQRLAGNRAVAGLVANGGLVQRCCGAAPGKCTCGGKGQAEEVATQAQTVQTAGLVQRCCGAEPGKCKCGGKGDEEQAAGDARPVGVQRTIGDGHDLGSPRLAGVAELEAAFDDEREIKRGDKGPFVRKLQQALADAGHAPKFGADGDFGGATETAVKNFQESAGVPAAQADGVVRKTTMQRLDVIAPAGATAARTPPPAKTDFQIRGKQPNSLRFPNRIFFDRGDATLDSEETTKIASFVAGLPAVTTALDLNGFASEEGGAGANTAEVAGRITAVEDALRAAGHTGVRHRVPRVSSSAGRIDYRFMRSVELVRTGSPSTTPDCSAGPNVDCGPAPNPFTTAQTRANTLIDNAVTALSATPLAPNTATALNQLFGGPSAIPALVANLGLIKGQLANMTAGHRCHNECDGSCVGSIAYNNGDGPTAMMTLCPSFMRDPRLDERADTLIHEGSHGTTGLITDDLAYRFQRMITVLDQASALKNADSYAALVRLIDNPASVTLGPRVPDTMAGMSTAEHDETEHSLAFVEKWAEWASSEIGSLYDEIGSARRAGRWRNSWYEYTMSMLAPRFGLTRPPAVPSEQEKWAVAAIRDRYETMFRSMRSLTLTKSSTGPDLWAPGPGTNVTLSPAFFAQPNQRAKVDFLFRLLIGATPDISAGLVPKYLDFADVNRQHMGGQDP